ncbi:hypothetical protein [Helcococcus kunzii]|uniref:hypothetical protein n=1 Tax=Helcococcus kunzii TaxID=40091 RepID=UPI0024ACADE4|nr:hypothetical protein [Helcococcus kunzii]
MNKKIYFSILLFISICMLGACNYGRKISGREFSNITIDYNNQGIHNPKSILKSKDKFYIDNDGIIFSVSLKDFNYKLISTLTYIDGKYKSDLDISKIGEFKEFEEKSYLPDVHLVDDKIVYISEVKRNGENYYKLSSIDLDGKNKKDYITFYEEVTEFKVCDGYFVISTINNGHNQIYLYDKKLNSKKISINGTLSATYQNYLISEVVNGEVVDVYRYDVNSGESKLILHDYGFVKSVSNGLISTTKLNNFYDINSNYKSFVFDFLNMNKIKEFDNLIPLFFDENYIYFSKGFGKQVFIKTDRVGKMIYKYDSNKIKEENNYSNIIANIDDNLICMDNKTENKYYIINLKDNSVRKIDFNKYYNQIKR